MADAPLVSGDIEAGRELVRLLDTRKFPVTGAAWIYFSDLGEWRLVIRSPEAAKNLNAAYLELAKAMDAKADFRSQFDLARVKLVPPNDRMFAAIGKVVRVEGLNEVRFSKNLFNGIFVDDALIYRLAA